MLGFLFRGLTAEPARGAALFDAVTGQARRTSWYVEGEVPDTLDGRFAVLATVAGLVIARIEQEGNDGNALSVAVTERFIEVMESEHRELGLGDPGLGRTVRKLVGMLARRTQLWREARAGERDWAAATRESLYKTNTPDEAVGHSAAVLKSFSTKLDATPLDRLAVGEIA